MLRGLLGPTEYFPVVRQPFGGRVPCLSRLTGPTPIGKGFQLMQVRGLAVAAMVLCVMGGCTSPAGDGVVPSASGAAARAATAPTDPVTRERELVACMRKAGVSMPDPVPGDASGRSALAQAIEQGLALKETFQAALDGCAAYLAPEDRPTPAGPADPDTVEQKRRFAQCMRDNGVKDFPDPDPATGELGGWIRRDDPTAMAAADKCRVLLPTSAPSTPTR
jgi:hypothetical protein